MPFNSLTATIIFFALFLLVIGYVAFLFRNGNRFLKTWVMTGHFIKEVSEEKNMKLRSTWLKLHKNKERTKPRTWNITLTNPVDSFMLNPVYPVDKYGRAEIIKDPLYFRGVLSITHHFYGNLPVSGDKINFSWKFTSNNNIKALRVRAVEYVEGEENKIFYNQPTITEVDEMGTEGHICAENLITGKKNTLKGTVKLSEKVKKDIHLCFWYMPQDAEGESVFKLKF